MENKIVMIAVEKIHPHKDNPRKELGDLTELAASIKAKGIFQNLTVVPNSGGKYTVIIGHRRLAASKLAGLTEVPCVVRSMSEKEQIATMLLENMQRSDLTIIEQAEGMQMMLDLGESVQSIADRTGFSVSTVRRRTNLLKLDREGLRQAEMRGGTLDDYEKLMKIEDEEERNTVLKHVGTASFEWMLKNAEGRIQNRKTLQTRLEVIKTFAKETEDVSGYIYIKTYYGWNKDEKVIIPEDKDMREYVYEMKDSSVVIYTKPTEEEEAAKNEQKRKAEEAAKAAEGRKEALKAKFSMMKEMRESFLRRYRADKNGVGVISIQLLSLIKPNYCTALPSFNGIIDLLGLGFSGDLQGKVISIADAAESDEEIYRALAAAVYLMMLPYNNNCYDYSGKYNPNAKMEEVYEFLTALGYKMSDEEKALLDGTHELYGGGCDE